VANSQNFNDQSGLPKKSSGGGCLKALGIGCGSIVFLTVVVPMLMFGGGAGGGNFVAFIAVVVVLTLLIVLSRRNARKNPPAVGPSSEKYFAADEPYEYSTDEAAPVVGTSKYLAEPPRPTHSESATSNQASGNFVVAPACQHRFLTSELAGKKTTTCVCGRKYQTADLLEYKRLQDELEATSAALQKLRYKLASVEVAGATSSASAASATTVAAPVRVKAPKAKVSLSLQQWLIIGASILVLVAGSVFVSTNIKTMPQWQFELITIGVGAATAFGAFKARRISVLLANFLAVFSSAMQLATTSIIGDQLSTDFIWSNAPAWWWAIELTVHSAAATVLAKFSRNFGWKVLALLGSTAAAVVLELGVLNDKISHTAFPLHLALVSISAVVVLAQNRFLRAIPQPEVIDKAFAAYAEDLAKREDNSLRVVGVYAAALQLVVGAGLSVISIFWSNPVPFEVIPLLALAAAWVPIALTSRFWADQVWSTDSEAQANTVSSGTIFVTLSIAAAACAATVHGSSLLLSGLLNITLLGALLFAGPWARKLAPTANIVTGGLWAGAAVWLEWLVLTQGTLVQLYAAGIFVVLFGLMLSLADLRLGILRNAWIAPLVNGLGLVLISIDVKSHNTFAFDSAAFAVVALAIVAAGNLQIAARTYISSKQGKTGSALGTWISLGLSALTLMYLQIPTNPAEWNARHGSQIAISLAFMAYAVLAQALAVWSPLKKSFGQVLSANNYLGQWAVVFGLLLSVGSTSPDAISTNALLIGGLAVINYAFGTLSRSTVKMQLGYSAALASFLVYQWSVEDALRATNPDWSAGSFGFAWKLALQVALVGAATWLHTWFLRKRTNVSELTLVATPIVATGVALAFGAGALGYSLTHDGFAGALGALVVLSVAALASSTLARFGKLAHIPTRSAALGWVGIEYASFGILSNLMLPSDQHADGAHLSWILSTLVFAVVVLLKHQKTSSPALVGAFYLANLSSAWGAADLTSTWLNSGSAPEPYTVWLAAAIVVSTLLVGRNQGWLSRALLIDVPLLGAAAVSAIYALSPAITPDAATWRGTVAFGVIATHAYLRSKVAAPGVWITVGYLAGAGSALWLGTGLHRWYFQTLGGPEIYSILVAVSVVLGNRLLVSRLGAAVGSALADLRAILLVGVLALPSLFYGLLINPSMAESEWRVMLAAAAIAALAYLRINRSGALPWIVVGYLASAGTAWAAAGLLTDHAFALPAGPEVHSLLILVAVLLTHRLALRHLKLKSTWFSWGLPVGVALLPSALFTYTYLTTPLDQLHTGQIARVVIALVVSAALLIQGARFGNLANASMGLLGLALIGIPNTAMHANSLIPDSQVESTALVVGSLVFVTLWLLRKYSRVVGNSLLFIGVPVILTLAPALVKALIALTHPTLNTVDWWRFGIVLVASMTLLFVGTMREIAGMFFPGLVSLLLAALPYGFRQTEQNQWFLWVLLLLVAGVMVWLAVHLEKMKKAGRTSATWIKELK
jgi:hypothetical protein